MKTTGILLPFAVLALIGWGCSDPSQNQTEDVYEDTTNVLQESAQATGNTLTNAWSEVADFSVEQKDRFVSSMNTAYTRLESQVENLRQGSGDISDEVATKFDEASAAFQEQMKKAGDASSDAWDATKDGVSNAWNKLVEAYERMKSEASS